jgi:hypothetical protein
MVCTLLTALSILQEAENILRARLVLGNIRCASRCQAEIAVATMQSNGGAEELKSLGI